MSRPAAIEFWIPDTGPPLQPSLTSSDDLPPGPYAVSMQWNMFGRKKYWSEPFSIVAANRQCIAAALPSRAIAERVCRALNARMRR